jgi:hypothetical protein
MMDRMIPTICSSSSSSSLLVGLACVHQTSAPYFFFFFFFCAITANPGKIIMKRRRAGAGVDGSRDRVAVRRDEPDLTQPQPFFSSSPPPSSLFFSYSTLQARSATLGGRKFNCLTRTARRHFFFNNINNIQTTKKKRWFIDPFDKVTTRGKKEREEKNILI